MKPENTEAQRKRRRGAVFSAVFASLWLLGIGAVFLWLRSPLERDSFGSRLLLVLAVLALAAVIPVWVNLKVRLKEIKGGEEDAASQY